MKHVYNESVNFIESNAVHFDINGPLNCAEMVPVICMGLRAHLFCTWDYLMLGICSLIKPTARKKLQLLDATIPAVLLWYTTVLLLCFMVNVGELALVNQSNHGPPKHSPAYLKNS